MDIPERIISRFEDNLNGLTSKTRFHWVLRMWRITGNKKYLNLIKDGFYKIVYLEDMSPKTHIAGLSDQPESKKKLMRRQYYSLHPQLTVAMKIIHRMFYEKSFGFLSEDADSSLKGFNFSQLLLDTKLIYLDPSQVANHIYYLKFIGRADLESQMIKKMKEFWLTKKPLNKIEWQNKVYGMTHIIIASTYFYQRNINYPEFRNKFAWILNYFRKDFEAITANCTTDILTEVALCFKFLGYEKDPVFVKLKKLVKQKFNSELSMIAGKTNRSLSPAEHRNILAVMLFTNDLRFIKGPIIGPNQRI